MAILHRLHWLARRTGRIAGGEPRATLWTLVVLIAALLAVGVSAIAADNVARWSTSAPSARGRGASMVVYLGEAVGDDQARAIAAQLTNMAGVERAELVGSDETAKRLATALGTDRAALLDGIDARGLPASIEVTLAPGVRDVVALSPTVKALKATPGVDDVVIADTAGGAGSLVGAGAGATGATSNGATSNGATSNGAGATGATSNGATSNGATSNGATSNGATSNGATSNGAPGVAIAPVGFTTTEGGALATVRAACWAGAGVFGGLALLVVLAAVRVRLDRTRQERQVAYLLGADPGYFVVPTALAGALYAAAAACIAGALLRWGVSAYGDDIAQALATTIGAVEVRFPALADVALFAGGAAAIGFVGGALAGMSAAPAAATATDRVLAARAKARAANTNAATPAAAEASRADAA